MVDAALLQARRLLVLLVLLHLLHHPLKGVGVNHQEVACIDNYIQYCNLYIYVPALLCDVDKVPLMLSHWCSSFSFIFFVVLVLFLFYPFTPFDFWLSQKDIIFYLSLGHYLQFSAVYQPRGWKWNSYDKWFSSSSVSEESSLAEIGGNWSGGPESQGRRYGAGRGGIVYFGCKWWNKYLIMAWHGIQLPILYWFNWIFILIIAHCTIIVNCKCFIGLNSLRI